METHDVEVVSAVSATHSEPEPGSMFTSVLLEVSRHRNAVITATAERIRNSNGPVTAELLAELSGEKVTLLYSATSMMGANMLIARPGTLFNNGEGILPKGKRRNGFVVDVDRVVAVNRGYKVEPLVELYDKYSLGEVVSLDAAMLSQLPSNGSTCSLAVLTTYRTQGSELPCLWLCHSYLAADDIVEGMLVVPETGGLVSEYGSIKGKDLVGGSAAVLVDANPVPFADAINYTSPTEAYTALGL